MELTEIVHDIAAALKHVDESRVPFRNFQPGVGPYGEPQLVKTIAGYFNTLAKYGGAACTKRTPDLLLPGEWALEFKITRPFGDNGREAESWSVNLLHPYEGNVSTVGDCRKLASLARPERKAVVVIGYEHTPPRIDLMPLVESFELIATRVARVSLGERAEVTLQGLVHPVHQQARVFAWEVLPFE